MLLPDGYHDVPAGSLATVVTYLEMTAVAPARPERVAAPWTLRPVAQPGLNWYRDLHRRVGADWLWSSRLSLTDAALSDVLGAPGVDVHALMADGRDEGFLELDFRVPGECELAFFGLTPALVGHGAGRWLMNRAVALAWSRPIRRFGCTRAPSMRRRPCRSTCALVSRPTPGRRRSTTTRAWPACCHRPWRRRCPSSHLGAD